MMTEVSYQIKKETQALVPKYDEFGNLCTVVYELYGTYTVNQSPRRLLEENCSFYGCAYEGCLKAAKAILGLKQMVPICINQALQLYVMPTCSPDSDQCCWLALDHIREIEEYGHKQAKVTLTNRTSLIIEAHKDTLEARKAKTALLYYTLERRIGLYSKLEQRLGFHHLWRLL